MAELTPKQKEVMDCFIHEKPKILAASGAKRAGKTFVLILLFLMHIAKFENQGSLLLSEVPLKRVFVVTCLMTWRPS